MAEETSTATETSTAAPAETTTASTAAPKRKNAASKSTASKTTAGKTTARKTATGKASAGKAPAAKATARKKAAPRKTATKRGRRKATPDLAARAQEAGRNAFLASLGFYGKAFDQVQEQFSSLQGQLEARRKVANKTYAELVKRGTRVEKDAKGLIRDIELPRLELDSLTDRKKLEAKLDLARARLNELRASVGLKSAA